MILPQRPRLTERDIQLIRELYKLGIMKMRQIHELYFSGTTLRNAQIRVAQLTKRGYIKRDGHFYRATVKGIRWVGEDVKTRPDKLVDKSKRSHVVKLGDIYTKLHDSGWEWLSSRAAKAKHRLDRLCKLDGILYNTFTDQEYSVYLLSRYPQGATIGRIHREIQRLSSTTSLYRVIVFCQSVEGFIMFGEGVHGAANLHVYPYPLGVSILRKTSEPQWLDVLIKETLVETNHVMLTREIHADRIIEIEGIEYYVTELITNDTVKKYHLEKYGQDQAAQDRAVKIICLDGQQHEKLLNKYTPEAYPHFDFVVVPRSWLFVK